MATTQSYSGVFCDRKTGYRHVTAGIGGGHSTTKGGQRLMQKQSFSAKVHSHHTKGSAVVPSPVLARERTG